MGSSISDDKQAVEARAGNFERPARKYVWPSFHSVC
jgi:hypothetical protein